METATAAPGPVLALLIWTKVHLKRVAYRLKKTAVEFNLLLSIPMIKGTRQSSKDQLDGEMGKSG
jgi:hypothetical protein